MENMNEYQEILTQRENMYRFLSKLFKNEVDENLYEIMKDMSVPDDIDEGIGEGYNQMRAFIDSDVLDPISDLAVDYAKVFYGAGIVDSRNAAYPYESIYTSDRRLVMQEARDEMFHLLQSKDIGVKKGYDIPEDHLFIQLEFMAFMCKEALNAINENDERTAQLLIEDQKEFIEKHLMNWVPEFSEDVKKFAQTDFYKGLATVAERFIKMDLIFIEDFMTAYAE
jgi:anaerobic sulfite reductase subunit A